MTGPYDGYDAIIPAGLLHAGADYSDDCKVKVIARPVFIAGNARPVVRCEHGVAAHIPFTAL